MGFLSRLFALCALLAAGAALIAYSGVYDMAATTPHWKPVRNFLQYARDRSVERHARGITAPDNLGDTALIHLGFAHFREMCVECHGAPGVERSEMAFGLYPKAPRLSRAAREFRSRELYWIVKNGLKMTGMPAFGPTHEEKELWAITAFLQHLPSLDSAGYADLAARWKEEPEERAPAVPEEGMLKTEPAGGHRHP